MPRQGLIVDINCSRFMAVNQQVKKRQKSTWSQIGIKSIEIPTYRGQYRGNMSLEVVFWQYFSRHIPRTQGPETGIKW